ncbi:MAG TPA: hypothetical protein VFU69_08515 [Ktedonobacterales bacterium]|nr:hypothetical protein [Ktedonobacterales bacterium]
MGGSLRQLTSRQFERLKSELAEVIIANFCYPAFLDYRLNLLRTRPVDRRKRQEVWAYVSSINFNPLANMDAASMDFRRFVERAFLRYIDTNRALAAVASARQVATLRARVPQLAAAVARGLADYLVLGEASTFGQARLVESWGATRKGATELTWEQIEKSTQMLQTTLVYLRTTAAESATTGTYLKAASLADISAYPTRMLPAADTGQPLALAGAGNGTPASHYQDAVNHASGNGASADLEELTRFSSPFSDDGSGPRGQFRGPLRSPTSSRPVSRPVDRSLETPPVTPAGAAPNEPKATVSWPIEPAPTLQPAPDLKTEMPQDAWQELLIRGSAEPPAASNGATPPVPPDQPDLDLDLPDLPESFGTPRLLDLPPDLAELYGDYLRDARAARLDLTDASERPPASDGQSVSSAAPLPPSETDEEVDALFDALSSHIAAQGQREKVAQSQQRGSVWGQADADASGAEPPSQPRTDAPGAASEVSDVPQPSAPLTREEEQPAQQARAKGVTDGDVMIFSQLQHQISTWIKMAAVSHQIELAGRDAAELVAELRRMAALEEAELQVIESLVALCHRVTSTKQATMEDYKQAMMLYLLHHRSRLAL